MAPHRKRRGAAFAAHRANHIDLRRKPQAVAALGFGAHAGKAADSAQLAHKGFGIQPFAVDLLHQRTQRGFGQRAHGIYQFGLFAHKVFLLSVKLFQTACLL